MVQSWERHDISHIICSKAWALACHEANVRRYIYISVTYVYTYRFNASIPCNTKFGTVYIKSRHWLWQYLSENSIILYCYWILEFCRKLQSMKYKTHGPCLFNKIDIWCVRSMCVCLILFTSYCNSCKDRCWTYWNTCRPKVLKVVSLMRWSLPQCWRKCYKAWSTFTITAKYTGAYAINTQYILFIVYDCGMKGCEGR